jgi:HAD superfamily hydrolase (TIGR01549 family)
LERVIRELRADEPLLPVVLIVPNRLLGVWLNQRLFVDTGHMAIDFMLAHELAWRVAAPALLREGRSRVPENVGLALLLGEIPEAIAHPDTPAYLREAARTAGFGPAALRTLGDLAGALLRPEALEAQASTAADPERLRLMARLWRGYEAGLEKARLVDRARLYRLAQEALPSSLVGGVVLCGFDDPAPAEAAFLEALRRHHPFAAVGAAPSSDTAGRHAARQEALTLRLEVTWGGVEPSGESALARMQSRLFAQAATSPADLDQSVQVLSAAGESLEAVEIARLVQQAAAEGVRYREMAILLRSSAGYSVSLAAAFDRAGIDAFFVEGAPRLDPAARSLSLLLDLVGADLDRGRVMEFLTTARVRWGSVLGPEADVSPSRFDRLSARGDRLPGCRPVLQALAPRYRLGVVTNGIDRVQRSRLAASGLVPFFETIVTSQGCGYAKPDPRILHVALDALAVAPQQAVYVGDDPAVDGAAASAAGVRFIWMDRGHPVRGRRPRNRIVHLDDLVERL